MSKVNIPPLLITELNKANIGYEIVKGAIYYYSVEEYKRGQALIKLLQRKLPSQGYNKFGNKKVKLMIQAEHGRTDILCGIKYNEPVTFDSEDEADYYFCLKDEQNVGRVKKIQLHPRLELFPAFTSLDGNKKLHVIYTPDFYVEYTDGRREYVDVKGMSTEAGDLRRKLYDCLAATDKTKPFYGIPLRWVSTSYKYGDKDGWIDYDELQRIRAKNRKAKMGA